jgi:hypothetical protein
MTTNIDFSTLNPSRIEEWMPPLGDLLLEADSCLHDGDRVRRLAVMQALNEFMDFSPFQSLDKIAHDTVQDLMGASLEDALKSIASRTAHLQRLTADIKNVSSEAQKDAASLRLEAVTKVLDATTGTIRALTELRDAVKNDAKAGDLVKKVVDLINKTQTLRNELERTPRSG